MNIEEFCNLHAACKTGRAWAIENCSDMQDAWGKLRPDWLVWVATRKGVLTDKELRLFAVFCARKVEHLLTDQRSRDAIDIAERFANGEATSDELAAAWAAAQDAAWAAARHAAWAAQNAARDAARDAAWGAARDAARAEAWDAARAESWDAQAAWLRENTTPNFGRD